MGNMNTDPDWMFDEYGRREYLSQPEGRVATDEERREAQRRNEQERKKREAERLKELGQEGKDEQGYRRVPLQARARRAQGARRHDAARGVERIQLM